MKLYTEEQVIDIFQKYGNMSEINARNIIDLSESIELPSDEEIEESSPFRLGRGDYNSLFFHLWSEGAKWMCNKIQGGNK